MSAIRVLFIGESWQGSCARSLREALARRSDIELADLSEDSWFAKPRRRWLRALNRLTASAYRAEFNAQVLDHVRWLRPDVVMTYKGYYVHADLIRAIRTAGAFAVCAYPDCSPHAHGEVHHKAVGEYDLVISTKPYHPALWHDLYGYHNRCVFVPQGYDPALHLMAAFPTEQPFDIVMVSTYRREYGQLMVGLAHELNDPQLTVAIGGNGWKATRTPLPAHWRLLGGLHGREYVSALRSGKICIAPLTREVVIDGQRQPGDVDSTRTYELAAAHCFFIHRRTEYVKTLYDEASEVPMFDNVRELAGHVRHYVAAADARAAMAAAAHRRAVPEYAIDRRAAQIIDAIKKYA